MAYPGSGEFEGEIQALGNLSRGKKKFKCNHQANNLKKVRKEMYSIWVTLRLQFDVQHEHGLCDHLNHSAH